MAYWPQYVFTVAQLILLFHYNVFTSKLVFNRLIAVRPDFKTINVASERCMTGIVSLDNCFINNFFR